MCGVMMYASPSSTATSVSMSSSLVCARFWQAEDGVPDAHEGPEFRRVSSRSAIQRVADVSMARAEKHPRLAIVEVLLGALVASAFLNNTPVVVVLLPIMMKLADVTGISAKKLLMPLSIAAVLGGTLTLIGTSTNLVVDGIVRDAGMPRFGIFEITPIRSEEHTSELQSLMRISYAVFCLKKKKNIK